MDSKQEKKILIIMPAYNEAGQINQCLESFVSQTHPPDELRIVNDNSTDNTANLVREYSSRYPWIQLLNKNSSQEHQPGAKVVDAFKFGLTKSYEEFDLIGKFDADIILPPSYFQRIIKAFGAQTNLGMCSGLLYVKRNGIWRYESIANRSHVRGPVKLYSRECFKDIGGLRPSIGWDTADTLLAIYKGYNTLTIPELKVKHLRPTGSGYSTENARLQGIALYKLNYGWLLSLISALKMSWKRRDLLLPFSALRGYLHAHRSGEETMLNTAEGRFVRRWRWEQIRGRLFQNLGNGQAGGSTGVGRAE